MALHLLSFIFLTLHALGAERTFKDFPKVEGKFNKHKIENLFIAANNNDRQLGLMHVQDLKDNEGVLFAFETEQMLSFWMKNTFVPLTIGFLDKNGCLLELIDMAATSVMQVDIPQYHSTHAAQFALEMKQGWFKKRKITVGSRLNLDATIGQRTDLSTGPKNLLRALTRPWKCALTKEKPGA